MWKSDIKIKVSIESRVGRNRLHHLNCLKYIKIGFRNLSDDISDTGDDVK